MNKSLKTLATTAAFMAAAFAINDNKLGAQNAGPGGFTPQATTISATPTDSTGNKAKTEAPKVKVYDMRQYQSDSIALKNAAINSAKGVLVIVVESNNQTYIDLVEEVANEKIAAGQTRIAIILAKKEATEGEHAIIVGNGKVAYYLLPTPNMEAARADLVKTIGTAYEKLITPLLSQKQVSIPATESP